MLDLFPVAGVLKPEEGIGHSEADSTAMASMLNYDGAVIHLDPSAVSAFVSSRSLKCNNFM